MFVLSVKEVAVLSQYTNSTVLADLRSCLATCASLVLLV